MPIGSLCVFMTETGGSARELKYDHFRIVYMK
jgi:hypothetical protein